MMAIDLLYPFTRSMDCFVVVVVVAAHYPTWYDPVFLTENLSTYHTLYCLSLSPHYQLLGSFFFS